MKIRLCKFLERAHGWYGKLDVRNSIMSNTALINMFVLISFEHPYFGEKVFVCLLDNVWRATDALSSCHVIMFPP